MANRIYYAVHQVGLKEDGNAGAFTEVHGVQSVGMTTNFNLEQVFELGQLAIYENIEQIPDVEVTMSKVLDGYPLAYCLASVAATDPTLAKRGAEKSIFGLSIFDDTLESATGTPVSVVQCSGMYVSSLSYNFPLDDSFSEDITLVGNDKVWHNDARIVNPNAPDPSFAGAFDNNDDAPIGTGGVNRRENMQWGFTSNDGLDTNGMVADSDATVLPPDVYGITASGTNEKTNNVYGAHVSSITVSADLAREDINELGRKGPYYRALTFPLEVTTEIEVTSTSGDMVSATEEGILTTDPSDLCADLGNLSNRSIRIATCEGTRIYLGTKNKLSSVNYTGGDAGGGNVAVTYTYTTFNDFTVMHSGDPNSNITWATRDTYLQDV